MKYKNAKPIPFNAWMAKAIQDGRKTQTRRVIKNDFRINEKGTYRYSIRDQEGLWNDFVKEEDLIKFASKFQKGDILWVGEPVKILDYAGTRFRYVYLCDKHIDITHIPGRLLKWTKGDTEIIYPTWVKNKSEVPNGCIREMARTFIKIIDVRVEKVRDMEKRGNKRDDNPYVFVYDFEVTEIVKSITIIESSRGRGKRKKRSSVNLANSSLNNVTDEHKQSGEKRIVKKDGSPLSMEEAKRYISLKSFLGEKSTMKSMDLIYEEE